MTDFITSIQITYHITNGQLTGPRINILSDRPYDKHANDNYKYTADSHYNKTIGLDLMKNIPASDLITNILMTDQMKYVFGTHLMASILVTDLMTNMLIT